MLDVDRMLTYMRKRLRTKTDELETQRDMSLEYYEIAKIEGSIEEIKYLLGYFSDQEKSSSEKKNKLSKQNSDYINHHNLNGRKRQYQINTSGGDRNGR